MDTDRVDLVLRYTLAAAGEREGGEREVTATQLIKYAYLADVAHAAQHHGATFTGAPWTFSLLGPHAPEVEARIAPVARRIGATTRATYYLLDRDDLGHRRAAAQALPAVVISSLQHSLRSFSHDTNALLARVYATAPMRRAAPGDAVDFTPDAPAVVDPLPVPAPLSPRVRNALKARRVSAAAAPPPAFAPRYDETFARGQASLDSAVCPLAATTGTLSVDPTVWTDPGRR